MVRKADLLATLSVAALAAVAAFSTPTAAFAEEAPGDGVTVFETLVVEES